MAPSYCWPAAKYQGEEKERARERKKKRRGGLSSNFIITLGVCHSCAVTLLFCCDGTDSSLWNSVKLSCLLIQSDIHGSALLPPTPHLSLISFLIRGNMWFPSKCAILLEWFSPLIHRKIRQRVPWCVKAPGVCVDRTQRGPLFTFMYLMHALHKACAFEKSPQENAALCYPIESTRVLNPGI